MTMSAPGVGSSEADELDVGTIQQPRRRHDGSSQQTISTDQLTSLGFGMYPLEVRTLRYFPLQLAQQFVSM